MEAPVQVRVHVRVDEGGRELHDRSYVPCICVLGDRTRCCLSCICVLIIRKTGADRWVCVF